MKNLTRTDHISLVFLALLLIITSCEPNINNYQSEEINESIEIESVEYDGIVINELVAGEGFFVKRGEFWKLWQQAHFTCMSSATIPNATYFGQSNAYIGTLFNKSLKKKYSSLDRLELDSAQLKKIIQKSQGLPCNIDLSKSALDSMNISTPFAGFLGALESDTKTTLRVNDWAVEELDLDPFVVIMKSKKIRKILLYRHI